MAPARYEVSICFANYRAPMRGYPISVDHTFTNKLDAEIFARKVSHYLPPRDPTVEEGMPLAWVLVSALAASEGTRVSYGRAWCYLSFDPGGVTVKRHEIGAGYYGAKCVTCSASREAA